MLIDEALRTPSKPAMTTRSLLALGFQALLWVRRSRLNWHRERRMIEVTYRRACPETDKRGGPRPCPKVLSAIEGQATLPFLLNRNRTASSFASSAKIVRLAAIAAATRFFRARALQLPSWRDVKAYPPKLDY